MSKAERRQQNWGKKLLKMTSIAVIIGLNGCSFQKHGQVAFAEDKPKVVATHSLICHLVKTIAEDTLDLTCLIDSNQDPHTYRPTPSDLKAIEEAQLILYGGYELEPKIIELLKENDAPVNQLAVYETVVTEPILSEHNHEEEHEHEEEHPTETPKKESEAPAADPHVWHNVENVVAMVELLQSTLIQFNPTAVEVYLKNSVELTDKLWQLNAWIEEQIATIPQGQKTLVTVHDSFNYYVEAYQFEDYKTLQGFSPQSSPTASQLRELAIEIRQLGVPTIFAENTASDRVIRNVAQEAGVELAPTKLSADGLGTTENYIDMMTNNTCAIVNGLGGKCNN
ncbi:MAG: hypothetical protein Tsb0014_07370 [Pleurocapsa sp.]